MLPTGFSTLCSRCLCPPPEGKVGTRRKTWLLVLELFAAPCKNSTLTQDRVSSRNFILGGKLTDHVVVKPQRGEGRVHNYNYWQYLGGEVGSVWGGS